MIGIHKEIISNTLEAKGRISTSLNVSPGKLPQVTTDQVQDYKKRVSIQRKNFIIKNKKEAASKAASKAAHQN